MPGEASPSCPPLPVGLGCTSAARQVPSAGTPLQAATELGHISGALTFHCQLMAGETQCPKLLSSQVELPEVSPALTQLWQRLGCAGKLWGFDPSILSTSPVLISPPGRWLRARQ